MRFSLRELLVMMAAAPLAGFGLCFANPVLTWLVLPTTWLVVGAALVSAAVARGRHQARAIGFSLPALLYAAVLLGSDPAVKETYKGNLWTSVALQKPFQWVSEERSFYLDPKGNRLEDRPADYQQISWAPEGFGPGHWRVCERPRRRDFMTLGHCLWTLLFGYAGMKYAQFVVARRDAGGEDAPARG